MFLIQVYISLHILIWVGATGSDGLKNVRLDAPQYVRKGEDVNLTCQYDIDTRSLYAVKWYRGSDEFARYLPKEMPPKQVFPQRGINVNVSLSNENRILLTNLSRESSGIYKCVVSAETTFKTLSDDQEVNVVVIGYENPRLLVNQLEYNFGDSVNANCSVERTSHPVNLTWYINNVEVSNTRPKSFLIHDPVNPEVLTSISTFSFTLPESSSVVRLKCVGQLHSVYNGTTEIEIRFKQPRRYSMMSASLDTLAKRLNHTSRGTAAQQSTQQSSSQRYAKLLLVLLCLIPGRNPLTL